MMHFCYRQTAAFPNDRKAIVIIAVLVIVVILSLAGYRYVHLMTQEYRAAVNTVHAGQTRELAESGVNFAAMVLSNPEVFYDLLYGEAFDNPDVFHGQLLFPSETGPQGYFSIVSPAPPGELVAGMGGDGVQQPFRFGVQDESGKINLNAMMKLDPQGSTLYQLLVRLPNMDESTAAAIVDWIDTDNIVQFEGGAEEYEGYSCKNGPLDSLDELLLVQGVTKELLFGGDDNRNGVIDGNEIALDELNPLGLSAYVTIYSREQNIDSLNRPRVNINGDDLSIVYTLLSERISPELAAYVVLYRYYGGKQLREDDDDVEDGIIADFLPEDVDLTDTEKKLSKIESIYDLIDSKVRVRTGSGRDAKTIVYLSPLNDYLNLPLLMAELFDVTTTSEESDLPARININTAPEAVLWALQGLGEMDDEGNDGDDGDDGQQEEEALFTPFLTEEDVESIYLEQPYLTGEAFTDPTFISPAWLISLALLDPDKVADLEKYITTRSQVFRFQVVGYFDSPGPVTRIEAVIDTNAGRPRILYFRDLSVLGKGFDLQLTN